MDEVGTDLRRTVECAIERLLAISERDSSIRPAPDQWSRKEIIGHLIDSAANNHQRFVRAQFQDDLVFASYEQNGWVRAQLYQDEPWKDLVGLWRAYNLHLAHLIDMIPAEIRLRAQRKHNFDVIAWQTVPAGESTTLDFFLRDYVGHMKHHLGQALDR